MKLRERAAKGAAAGLHRECAPEQTYERVRPHFRSVGITRVADITGLDRIGIPVYNAMVPRSNDVLSVFSGKGATPADAKTSAVMEAIERFAGALPLRPTRVAAYDDLVAAGGAVMRPGELNLELRPQYRDELPIYWVPGYDLRTEETVLVPQGAVTYSVDPGAPACYRLATANGLASGNTLEEAVCHALCELIERDALTIAEILSSRLVNALATGQLGPARSAAQTAWLRELHPQIDPDALPPRATELLDRFRAAGVDVRLLSIASDLGVPTVLAVSTEDNGPATSKAHTGIGTSPDAEVAVLRAITECAQSRAVDVQATREDFEPPAADVPDFRLFAKRVSTVDKDAWPWRAAGEQVRLADLATHRSDDIVADIRFMLDRLRDRQLGRVVAVDVSPPGIPVRVARVLVPGLESWGTDRSRIGVRAARAWNEAIAACR
ncbi:MAG TPA: YcaO-like family protein [Mycobacteriales bacterium]|nr:YcaO-like family protein [Mycobacteriales bacterium]